MAGFSKDNNVPTEPEAARDFPMATSATNATAEGSVHGDALRITPSVPNTGGPDIGMHHKINNGSRDEHAHNGHSDRVSGGRATSLDHHFHQDTSALGSPFESALVSASSASSESLQDLKQRMMIWNRTLRDAICGIVELMERDLPAATAAVGKSTQHNLSPRTFERQYWERTAHSDGERPMVRRRSDSPIATHQLGSIHEDGGGGEMSLLRNGRLFEKAGVNISTVQGVFSERFRREVPGAQESQGEFWASGLSLVIHPRNPHVPAIHMNTRMVVTNHAWFGGGIDLNPALKNFPPQLIEMFHLALRHLCNRYDASYYPAFSKHCDEYFFIAHRQCARGAGGIFFDGLRENNERTFAFIQDVGRTFASLYPLLTASTAKTPWNALEREEQLTWRGYYAEFNLVYDRGTRFGLQTGANPEAVLMSLPPVAKW